jgi:hypothetical protein
MVKLINQAKQRYKDKDIIKCLADKTNFVLDYKTFHMYCDEVWAYDINNGNSIKLYDKHLPTWAKIITRKQHTYELW